MTQHPAESRPHDDVIREARTRLRTVQKLAEYYCHPAPDFGTNSVAALLQQRWGEEIVPAAEELHERSRQLLQQLPYTAFQGLPAGPRDMLSQSEDLARDMGDNAQDLPQPSMETGHEQTNATLAQFLGTMGEVMRGTERGMRANNEVLAQQARAEQQQGGDRS